MSIQHEYTFRTERKIFCNFQVCGSEVTDWNSSRVMRKILLHPGQFVLPRRIYRDCRGLDAEGTLVRMKELEDEGLGHVKQRTQQQLVFYKALPTLDVEDQLSNHGVDAQEYRAKFFDVDYKVNERQRSAIHWSNPSRESISILLENQQRGGSEGDIESSDENLASEEESEREERELVQHDTGESQVESDENLNNENDHGDEDQQNAEEDLAELDENHINEEENESGDETQIDAVDDVNGSGGENEDEYTSGEEEDSENEVEDAEDFENDNESGEEEDDD